MNIEVTGCRDCPFKELDSNLYYSCNFPNEETYLKEDAKGFPITPDTCPLKKEPLTLSIKQ